VSMPHSGVDIPPGIESGLISPWLARKDADWWVNCLYDFRIRAGRDGDPHSHLAPRFIDCNRDPSGVSLYPGQNTTELCPTTTFDGDPPV